MIFFQLLIDYFIYFNAIFFMLKDNSIIIKLIKIFLAYLRIKILREKVITFILLMFKKKLKTIAKLKFSLS